MNKLIIINTWFQKNQISQATWAITKELKTMEQNKRKEKDYCSIWSEKDLLMLEVEVL